MPNTRPLTAKQQAFVIAFTDFSNPDTYCNATQSSKLARYKGSDKQLTVVGCENLAKPSIKQAIGVIQAKRAAKQGYNQQIAHELLQTQLTKADNQNDVPAAVSCIREMNTIYALRTEKVITGSLEQADALNDKQKKEAQAIATIRLAEITVHKPE